jgi:hypothetical protein
MSKLARIKNISLFSFVCGFCQKLPIEKNFKINRYLPQGKPWTLSGSAASRGVLTVLMSSLARK